MKFKIKIIHIILLLVVLIVSLSRQLFNIKEGYQSYTDCIDQGYPREFCLQVPPQAVI